MDKSPCMVDFIHENEAQTRFDFAVGACAALENCKTIFDATEGRRL